MIATTDILFQLQSFSSSSSMTHLMCKETKSPSPSLAACLSLLPHAELNQGLTRTVSIWVATRMLCVYINNPDNAWACLQVPIHSLTPDHQSVIITEWYFHRYKSNCSFHWPTSKKATPVWSHHYSHIDNGPVCLHYQTVQNKWEIGQYCATVAYLDCINIWSLILHCIMTYI